MTIITIACDSGQLGSTALSTVHCLRRIDMFLGTFQKVAPPLFPPAALRTPPGPPPPFALPLAARPLARSPSRTRQISARY
jgi:hypothetical protein